MSDITLHCVWCRGRLVVDDAGRGMEVPCPACGKKITIPPNPVWLPAINEALRRIVGNLVAGETDFATARLHLNQAITAAGYHPATACVGADCPEDLLFEERLNLVLGTNLDVQRGYGQFVQAQDPDIIDEWPCMEFYRLEDKPNPRKDWLERWKAAAAASGDVRAGATANRNVLAARKDSAIWQALGDGAGGYKDGLGNPFPPFAINSGMWTRDMHRKEALALGLIEKNTKIAARRGEHAPAFFVIEDERISEFLWNIPATCDHCGENKPTRLLHPCDSCGKSICPDCAAKGCDETDESDESSAPKVSELSTARECYREAEGMRSLCEFPLGKYTAERILQNCDRAFELGCLPDSRYLEARLHWLRGEALQSLGQKENALREYELAVEKDPQVGVKKRIASLRKECGKS